MNWIIFTTECTGKTTFCKKHNYKLGEFTLIDYDKFNYINTDRFDNELQFILLLNELIKNDNQLCFTNIYPPEFILHLVDPFLNFKFGILLLEKSDLINNIKNRHHELYESSYILQQYDTLKKISENDFNKLKIFKNFKDISYQFCPELRKVMDIKPKSIIRL